MFFFSGKMYQNVWIYHKHVLSKTVVMQLCNQNYENNNDFMFTTNIE